MGGDGGLVKQRSGGNGTAGSGAIPRLAWLFLKWHSHSVRQPPGEKPEETAATPPRRHDATNETFHNQIAVVGVIALGWWLTRAGIFPEVCCETQHTWLTPDVNVNVGTTQQPTDEATLQLIYDLILAKITKKPGVMMLLLLSLFNNGGKRGRTSDQLYSISNNNNKMNFARFIPNMGITLSLFVLMVMTTWTHENTEICDFKKKCYHFE